MIRKEIFVWSATIVSSLAILVFIYIVPLEIGESLGLAGIIAWAAGLMYHVAVILTGLMFVKIVLVLKDFFRGLVE